MVVKVSEIGIFLNCPRQVYFLSRGYELERSLENIIFKEIAHLLPSLLSEDEAGSEGAAAAGAAGAAGGGALLNRILDAAVEAVAVAYREELRELLGVADDGRILSSLSESRAALAAELEERGWLEKILKDGRFFEEEHARDVFLVSERLELSGVLDKLFRGERQELTPCIVRASARCPEFGVWYVDRIQLAAYALLLEEEFSTVVNRGLVEYIRAGEFREVLIRRKDRIEALRALKRIKKIKAGVFPEKSEHARCDICSFKDVCVVEKRSLASKLFGIFER
ncbi:MAG: CRISPR/Cas system-associated exonuclease Cas4 [Candidatus Alkanophagales archaeon MCA70_species_1]|nr:CRISPR/Cas system-associated exonuclease Cas4 [Candidatus Alkanophaga volatiphilum]